MIEGMLQRFLQQTGFITAAQAEDIAAHFAARTLSRHEFLLREGNINDAYLFLETGCMRAFAYDTDGNDVTTGFYTGGQVVLEVASFFNRTPSQENIQALTDCTGCTITYAQLNGLFHARPEFREFGRAMLVRGFANLKGRMLEMITTTAAERYEALLKASPEIVQHAPLKTVASYLGITDTSLSRIRKESLRK
ncbi:Crp/Fnr family transcriptional regulator [Hymenobacter lucidus]|uniref:Crp/Fnr family transcriptional regulator n=1 Tax=Hymenobacter lucidus TaxID=2880930 RepID=A0ABS8AYH1_9BACT|nr:Crp/Fnr family transcriptional regulator [Hymenobacter lucidus]MCB2410861.1 Crp/Fnr family transcriptional regulator [Hymenobacter lucidus]